MALPVIKATKFNYGAYAQPKQVKFKDPNVGIVAGVASISKEVVQKIEENKLQEQKNNITIAKNNSEYKYAATQLQNQFGYGHKACVCRGNKNFSEKVGIRNIFKK